MVDSRSIRKDEFTMSHWNAPPPGWEPVDPLFRITKHEKTAAGKVGRRAAVPKYYHSPKALYDQMDRHKKWDNRWEAGPFGAIYVGAELTIGSEGAGWVTLRVET